MDSLEKLFYLTGISADYFSFSGEHITVPREVRMGVLREMGYDPDDQHAVQQAIADLDARPWQSWLQPLHIISQGITDYLDIRIHSDEKPCAFHWRIITECGQQMEGELTPAELPEVGEYYIGETRYSAHRLSLTELPVGYHRIELWTQRRRQQAQLLVAPPRCFSGNTSQQRLWGINCQLYTLRSARNWGIGDFSDLTQLIQQSAAVGADIVGLNPLHAPDMAGADLASPYSPSDRRFLNPLYIDPQQVQDFNACQSLCTYVETEQCQSSLRALRELSQVDYDAVIAVKYPVFEQMFQYFLENHLQRNSERGAEFQDFVTRQGAPLQHFSQFAAEYNGLAVASGKDPRFHQYLQWLAATQLQQCQELAIGCGMQIGIMGDLAIGAVLNGAEVCGNPDLFCRSASIGAPPDSFAEAGQNWHLPPLDPVALRRNNYQHFVDLLRANMTHCGALRIDHVMGLLRLWWCLPDTSGGAYVYYPLEDLLAILCLESHRNQCLIVGEDMGVVPDQVRERMNATSVYSNKLFYFERTGEQQFKPPWQHQEDALLMVANHDVPTLAGWWNGTDLAIRKELGLLENLSASQQRRKEDKVRLLDWLQAQHLLPESWGGQSLEQPFDLELCGAILKANARSQSRLVLFQLDDLQLLETPVNIPGTYREYPNWRRKQQMTTAVLFEDAQIQMLLASIDRERKL